LAAAATATISSKFIELSDPRTHQVSYEKVDLPQGATPAVVADVNFGTTAPAITSTTDMNGATGLSMVITYHDAASVGTTDQWQIIFPKGTQVGANSVMNVRDGIAISPLTCTVNHVFSSTNRAFVFPSLWSTGTCNNGNGAAANLTINDLTAPLGVQVSPVQVISGPPVGTATC
jgi:hypothetical protein